MMEIKIENEARWALMGTMQAIVIPLVSLKDHTVVVPLVILNLCIYT
jgi:hypothetical protein